MTLKIKQNVKALLRELPQQVHLVAAAKTRRTEEIRQAIEAGVRIIGENYVQEAERAYQAIGDRVEWHMIGHLQKNKVKKAVRIFDMIQTVDSLEIAGEIDRHCFQLGKVMPILLEINSGSEPQKTGIHPEETEHMVKEISELPNIMVMGLMTMGPRFGEPERARPYFAETRRVFEMIKGLNLPGVEMKYLSMGMSNTYKVAIEEGANMVRIGSMIFEEDLSEIVSSS